MKQIKRLCAITLTAVLAMTSVLLPAEHVYAAEDTVISESADDNDSGSSESSSSDTGSSDSSSSESSSPEDSTSEDGLGGNFAGNESSDAGITESGLSDAGITDNGSAEDGALGGNAGDSLGGEATIVTTPDPNGGDDIESISGAYTDTTADNLTILLRGLNEDNKQATFDAINQQIANILANGGRYDLTNDSYVDAEKYNNSDSGSGYDSEHCWAATCANILWTTGYAQQATNPLTNEAFKSEDEVMAYFSENFTDAPGTPDEGVKWFFNGAYSLNNETGVAHTISDASGGLLKDAGYLDRMDTVYGNNADISLLDQIGTVGVGVLVKWLETDGEGNSSITTSAHWMSVVGAVIDTAKSITEQITERYKAIIISHSDDDPAQGDLNASYADKLAAKAAQTNKYSVYKLTYDTTLNAWLIDNFDENRPTLITYLYGLMDSNIPNNAGGGADPDDGDKTAYVIVANDGSETYAIMENSKAVQNIDYFYNLTPAQLATSENIDSLNTFMVENSLPVFSPSKGVVTEGQNLEAYLTSHETFVGAVSINGIALPFDAYEIVGVKGGLCKLVLKDGFLSGLAAGTYVITINIQGIEVPVEFTITK